MRTGLFIILTSLTTIAAGQTANQSIQKGNEQYRQGKFEEAGKEYDAAMKAEPGNNTAKFNLAAATYRMGKEADAVKSYEELAAEKQSALKAKAYYNKGAILSKQKKLEESIEQYKNALRNDPADQQARENLQKALLELKKKEPPKKKEEDKKKNQQQKKPQSTKLNQKEAEQRLKLLEQKEKQLQERMQKQKSKSGGSQTKDW